MICTQWQSDLIEKVVCPFCSEVESKGGWWACSRCTCLSINRRGWYFYFLHSSCLQVSLNKNTELQFLPMANGGLPQLSVCLCETQSIYHAVCVPSQMGCNSNWLIWGFAESSGIDVPVQWWGWIVRCLPHLLIVEICALQYLHVAPVFLKKTPTSSCLTPLTSL